MMNNNAKSPDRKEDKTFFSHESKTYIVFLLLSAVLSFLYLEIVLPRGAHFPLLSDAWQYLKNYDIHFQRGGRWFNYLAFDLISVLPKRLAYYLDLLTTAMLWLCFLKPKRTIHHILLFSVLLLLILSSNIMFSVRFWPGGRIMTNLAAIMAVLVIRSDFSLMLKLPLILGAVLAIGGGYQFHHMLLILAFISPATDKTYNLKSFAFITGLWMVGFVISYYFADLLAHLKFGEGRAAIEGYRQSQIIGNGTVETVLLNAQNIIQKMIIGLFTQVPIMPVFILGVMIILTGVVFGIRRMSFPSDGIYRLLWWVAPIGAIIVILALANHVYYKRLNLSTLMVFVLGLWIIAQKSDLAMRAIILGSVFLFIPQTVSNTFKTRAIDRDITNTKVVLDSILDENRVNHKTRLTVYDYDHTLARKERNIRISRTYIKQNLGINRFLYCYEPDQRFCRDLDGVKKRETTKRACQMADKIYTETRGRQITVYIFNQKTCEKL